MKRVKQILNDSKRMFLAERGIYPVYGEEYYYECQQLYEALRDYQIAVQTFGKNGVYAINQRRSVKNEGNQKLRGTLLNN